MPRRWAAVSLRRDPHLGHRRRTALLVAAFFLSFRRLHETSSTSSPLSRAISVSSRRRYHHDHQQGQVRRDAWGRTAADRFSGIACTLFNKPFLRKQPLSTSTKKEAKKNRYFAKSCSPKCKCRPYVCIAVYGKTEYAGQSSPAEGTSSWLRGYCCCYC